MNEQPDTLGRARMDKAALDKTVAEVIASVDAMSAAEIQELCQDLQHTWAEAGTDS